MSLDATQTIKVMTYNTHHSSGFYDTESSYAPISQVDGVRKVKRLAQVIADQQPDIIGLQEVDRYWTRSGAIDQAALFASELGMAMHYGPNLDHDGEQFGVATLSNLEMIRGQNQLVPTPAGWEQRGMLDVRLKLPGWGEIVVINTHLQSDANGEHEHARKQRFAHALVIADYVAEMTGPTIVLGDFNAEPDSGDIDALKHAGLTDVWQVSGSGDGFTIFDGAHGEKTSRIDYIFVSSHFEILYVNVIDTTETRVTSDHLPLVATLRLRSLQTL